ncbi:MAG: cytochrome b N-terminal domain-containing protein [Nitrospinota bacterium]
MATQTPPPPAKKRRAGAWLTENRVWRSIFRRGYPDNDLDRAAVMFSNFFMHVLPARTHVNSLRPSYTWGLGIISFYLFIILVGTGVLLMFFYIPSTERAYPDMKDLQFVVSYGVILRNLHRWAAHAMVAIAFFHMCRVFYTGSYKPPREFNWVIGVLLWGTTLMLSFTGYLLPWDQLAYWAITVGTSIASYPPIIGEKFRTLMLGGDTVGQNALIRFYVAHVVVLPAVMVLLLGVHFWRIRKDGGLSRPLEGRTPGVLSAQEGAPSAFSPQKTYLLVELAKGKTPMVDSQAPEEEVQSWPHLVFRMLTVFVGVVAVLSILAYFFDAPLEELANPEHPPNPAKAPWYFLGLQEMVSYSALAGGVVVPAVLIVGLMSIAYIDRSREGEGLWFTSSQGRRITLVSFVGTIPLVLLLTYLHEHYAVRKLIPGASQLVVDLFNPGTILIVLFAIGSLYTWRRTGSSRMGALALYSYFLAAFVVYTVIGFFFRGPNWAWVWPW